jgi:ribosome-associated protein
MSNEFDFSVDPYIESTLGKKAIDVVVLDVRELTSYADVFIICSAGSSRQVSAIAEYIQSDLKKRKIRPVSVEGTREGQWLLLDYGQVIIHIFHESARAFYDLEGLWADAPRLSTPALEKERGRKAPKESNHA